MKLKIAVAAGFIILAFCASSIINTNSSATDRDLLSSGEISLVQTMLEKLQPYIDQRKQNGDVNMLTFEELYAQVDPHEKAFLAEFTKIKRVPEEKLNPTIPRSSFIAISNQI